MSALTALLDDRTRYAGNTSDTHADPEAQPQASGSALSPACAQYPELDWVPDTEDPTAPGFIHDLCSTCPLRTACLHVAVQMSEVGYWAGTTTNERTRLKAAGDITITAANRLRGHTQRTLTADRRARLAMRNHTPGNGSLEHYRKGCHCDECRRANRDRARRERRRRRHSRV